MYAFLVSVLLHKKNLPHAQTVYNLTPNQYCVVASDEEAQPCCGTLAANHPNSPESEYGAFNVEGHLGMLYSTEI